MRCFCEKEITLESVLMTSPVTVHGVDLYPPPQDWVPPNCILEVDDITKPWTFPFKFDLVHIRQLIGALPRSGWMKVYRRAYEYISPLWRPHPYRTYRCYWTE